VSSEVRSGAARTPCRSLLAPWMFFWLERLGNAVVYYCPVPIKCLRNSECQRSEPGQVSRSVELVNETAETDESKNDVLAPGKSTVGPRSLPDSANPGEPFPQLHPTRFFRSAALRAVGRRHGFLLCCQTRPPDLEAHHAAQTPSCRSRLTKYGTYLSTLSAGNDDENAFVSQFNTNLSDPSPRAATI
jgi:hypothetical protein